MALGKKKRDEKPPNKFLHEWNKGLFKKNKRDEEPLTFNPRPKNEDYVPDILDDED